MAVIFILFLGGVLFVVISKNVYKFKRGETFTELAIKLGKYGLQQEQKSLIHDFVPYYAGLSPKLKLRFEQRVAYFMQVKEFAGCDGIEPTLEMRTLISAIAIKITFGFKEFTLPHFHTIFVHPEEYYSPYTNHYHKGEVNLKGHIRLSWNNFTDGLADHHDGLNLAVHEFAHAVYFENSINNNHYHFIHPQKLRKWHALAAIEIEAMNSNEDHFIREYGATNLSEFFAVSTEHFFEQPFEYREKHPELYKTMASIYRQDPRRFLKTRS